jgi:hypothetical protein
MRMHTFMHAVSHRINISGPHMRPCCRILKKMGMIYHGM